MYFKHILFFMFFYYIFMSINVLSFDYLVENKVYNFDVGNRFVVYEYEEIFNNKSYHYVGLLNFENGIFERVLSNDGEVINNNVFFPSISSDDKYITYTTNATNVTGDTVGNCYNIMNFNLERCSNVYIYDVYNKKSYMIKNGEEYFNGNSYISKISGDGKSVVFESSATNNINYGNIDSCFEKSINVCVNIYKYNVISKNISLVSTDKNNYGGDYSSISPTISYDGKYVAFQSGATNLLGKKMDYSNCKNVVDEKYSGCTYVYLFNSVSKEIKLVSRNEKELFNDNSGNPIINEFGKYVIYESYATNVLIEGNNNIQNVILYDIEKDKNYIISKKDNNFNNRDSYLCDVSDNGKYIVFSTNSTNIDNSGKNGVYIYNLHSNKLFLLFYNELEDVMIKINKENFYYYKFDKIIKNKIDSIPPVIQENQIIYVIKDSYIDLKKKIVIIDNLCGVDEMSVYVDDNLLFNSVGECDVNITVVDCFDNISIGKVKMIVLEKDVEGPSFTNVDEIKILKGSSVLNVLNYINAIDKVDGNTQIYIIDDGGLDLNSSGKYSITLMSKDSSNNVSYKEVCVDVYENYDFQYYYQILLILGLLAVIIFSIIKVK